MRINFLFLFIFFVLFNNCQPKKSHQEKSANGNSVIEGRILGYHPKFSEEAIQLFVNDILRDDQQQYLAKVDAEGCFTFIFTIDYPQETMIRYSGKLMGLMSFPGDTTQIEIQVDNLDGYQPTIELVRALSKQLNYGNFVNDMQKFSMAVLMKYKSGKNVQDSFDNYYKIILQKKEEKQQYLDSLMSVNPDLDSILIAWAREHIEYGFKSDLINYYSINRMLNRASFKKNNKSESVFEMPIDMRFQSVCDSVLGNLDLGDYKSQLSASYAYFLNSFSAYDNYQFGRHKEEDYLMNFREYLQNKYDKDDFELIFTRLIYSRINGIKTHQDQEIFSGLKQDFDKQIIQGFDKGYQEFLTEELLEAEEIVKNGKPQAIKYDLTAFPDVDKFWQNEVLEKNKGKVIYIKFWAPWCGPCMGNWQSVNNLVNYYSDEDFRMINLCIDTKKEEWEETIKNHKITGIHYLLTREQSSVLWSTIGVNGIPYNLLIDKKGEVKIFDAMSTGSSEGQLNQSLIMQIDEIL